MGGIEKELKLNARQEWAELYSQMSDEQLKSVGQDLEERVISCLKEDDLYQAKCYLSQFKLDDRLNDMIKHVNLKRLHQALLASRGNWNSVSWQIVDQMKADDWN